jgi:aminoglycoside phosphotransferase (APT) family kinase protein
MSGPLRSAAVKGLDVERVSAWLGANIEGAVGPFEFSVIAGGRSNLTFTVVGSDGQRYVLRRPPLGHVLATAHDMAREHRIIAAIGATGVPVPPALGLCTDEAVNGAPFYVMGYVDGIVLDGPDKAAALPVGLRRPASEHLVDVLADLHALDVDEIGLGDLARREGYVERQLKRWSTQWANSKTRELPAIDEVAHRLSAQVPQQQGVVVAHGDFRFGNCLTDVTAGRIAAVLDWELCTLGDPLADVGYLGVYWTDPGDESRRHNDPSGAEGFPTYRELLDRYATRTGRDLSGIDYYVAFS